MSNDANNSVKDTDELRKIVREEVWSALRAFTEDPDTGLELRDDFVEKLKKSEQEAKEGKTTSFSDIKKQYLE